jgi:predicted amidohydrolase
VLKLTLAQLNPTIGDIEGNVVLKRDAAQQAHGSALVVFPELCLTVRQPGDGWAAAFAVLAYLHQIGWTPPRAPRMREP